MLPSLALASNSVINRVASETAHRMVLERIMYPGPPVWHYHGMPEDMRDAAYAAYPFSACWPMHDSEHAAAFSTFPKRARQAYQLELRLEQGLSFSARTYLTQKIRMAKQRQYEQNDVLLPMPCMVS
ncbi:hypothetical protein JX580_05660 [Thiomicrospira microaerophila]|uniref:hypothetical protein n=1 Tax=Thiomicrospira microaerophila TaxID=406020 RepID=UPI00200CE1EF|nr:hypothetical protein [Thiomicrospira microaerophila]UQB43347.1 hypothetical protein JX580_05660 [Thiomicrospira microaerophila]